MDRDAALYSWIYRVVAIYINIRAASSLKQNKNVI